MEASRRVSVMRAESGDIIGAYGAAKELVRRRPESGDAHFTLSYALRYGETSHYCVHRRVPFPVWC